MNNIPSPPRPIDSIHRRHGDPRFHIDWVLIAACLAVSAFGVVNIYAARLQWQADLGLNEFAYVRKQVIAIVGGCIGATIIMSVDYRRWREFALALYLATTGLLVVVLVAGKKVKGARAWFTVAGFDLQPSELAKATLVLAVAAYVSLGRGSLGRREFTVALGVTAVPTVLILRQPDLGTAMVFGVILLGLLLVAGAQPRHMATLALVGFIGVLGILQTGALKDYQINRLTAFVNPSTSKTAVKPTTSQELNLEGVRNNIRQSQTAIALGGLHGKGFLNGPQTNGKFVPEQHSDFIFSAVGEQFGFVGSGLLLAIYGLIALRIWRVAQLSRDLFGTLLCVGIMCWFGFQVFENVGMAMGIMPVTGIPLPLMSYGGSSTAAFLAAIGLVENVHMRRYL